MNNYNLYTYLEMFKEEKEEYKENMYLMCTLHIFNLRRKMKKISYSNKSKAFKEYQMIQLYQELKVL